jgi:hypothetical protein
MVAADIMSGPLFDREVSPIDMEDTDMEVSTLSARHITSAQAAIANAIRDRNMKFLSRLSS